jgi:hypothetical protein
MKLWKVTLRGFYGSPHRESYVVAHNADAAWHRVAGELQAGNIGSSPERLPLTIELIADADRYSGCGTRLYL